MRTINRNPFFETDWFSVSTAGGTVYLGGPAGAVTGGANLAVAPGPNDRSGLGSSVLFGASYEECLWLRDHVRQTASSYITNVFTKTRTGTPALTLALQFAPLPLVGETEPTWTDDVVIMSGSLLNTAGVSYSGGSTRYFGVASGVTGLSGQLMYRFRLAMTGAGASSLIKLTGYSSVFYSDLAIRA